MSELIAATPYTPALVRNSFFDPNSSEFTKCIVFGFRAEPGCVPMFQVMLDNGAQWARVPIHMLVSKSCEELPIETICWWDCYGYDFSIIAFPFLKDHQVEAIDPDGVFRMGNYLFTVDWMKTGWSEIPDQHKNHHIIALASGQWIAYPNNRLIWHDKSWITPLTERPKNWRSPTQTYSAEKNPRKGAR
jgi:hypothetical protein